MASVSLKSLSSSRTAFSDTGARVAVCRWVRCSRLLPVREANSCGLGRCLPPWASASDSCCKRPSSCRWCGDRLTRWLCRAAAICSVGRIHPVAEGAGPQFRFLLRWQEGRRRKCWGWGGGRQALRRHLGCGALAALGLHLLPSQIVRQMRSLRLTLCKSFADLQASGAGEPHTRQGG